jgi:hypothetical protein
MIFAAWFRLIKALLRDWLPHSEKTTYQELSTRNAPKLAASLVHWDRRYCG